MAFFLLPYLALGVELALLACLARPGAVRERMLGLLGLIAASKFIGFQLLGGNSFNPELPMWLIVVWGWLESIVWIALPVSVCAAFFAWAVRPFRRVALRVVLVLSTLLATYGMWEGMRVPPVVERVLEFSGLPSRFDGYRIAHLSDLHCSSAVRREKIAAIVARCNALAPDMVAITGDFVDGLPEDREHDLEPISGLVAKDGVWASAGNHEAYWDFDQWAPLYAKWNVRFLRNAWTAIGRGEDRIVVGGMDDPGLDYMSEDMFRGAPTNSFRILLFHRPIMCEANASVHGVRLQLSGHTHGGAMPVLSRLVALANEGHVRGLYHAGDLVLHVSPGSGQWAGFPLRLFNPPEITLIRLKVKK